MSFFNFQSYPLKVILYQFQSPFYTTCLIKDNHLAQRKFDHQTQLNNNLINNQYHHVHWFSSKANPNKGKNQLKTKRKIALCMNASMYLHSYNFTMNILELQYKSCHKSKLTNNFQTRLFLPKHIIANTVTQVTFRNTRGWSAQSPSSRFCRYLYVKLSHHYLVKQFTLY